MNGEIKLSVEKQFDVRFSEVDMMGVAWHGSYMLYLEDAREAFGNKYGLSYCKYITENIFVPVVDVKLSYKNPIRYGMKPIIKITYRPTESAKIIFDYEIYDPENNITCLKATSVQVFMDRDYKLLWYSPEFYTRWKQAMGLE